jgi:hypothetical protein
VVEASALVCGAAARVSFARILPRSLAHTARTLLATELIADEASAHKPLVVGPAGGAGAGAAAGAAVAGSS